MKILVACEESQAVTIEMRKLGHEAYSCDVQEPSGGHPEWHIHGDALDALLGGRIVTMDGKAHDVGVWDMLIAHPPCTYLSNAGACRLYPRKGELDIARYKRGWKQKHFSCASTMPTFRELRLKILYQARFSRCRRIRRRFSRGCLGIHTPRKRACGLKGFRRCIQPT